MDDIEERRKTLAKDLCNKFFLSPDRDIFFKHLDALKVNLPAEYIRIFDSFRYNLDSVMATVGLPIAIVSAIVSNYRVRDVYKKYGAHQIIEGHIEAKSIDDDKEKEWYKIAAEIHRGEMEAKGEAFHLMTDTINRFLLSTYEYEGVNTACNELILQGIILTWGAFELLCRDYFITYINMNPSNAIVLFTNIDTKKYYGSRSIDIDLLHEYDYDLSDSMGEVLEGIHNITSIQTIKAIFGVLFQANNDLRLALSDKTIWELSQKRHIIVHNRGIVDRRYIESTGSNVPIGSKINVNPTELESYIKAIANVGVCLFKSIGIDA